MEKVSGKGFGTRRQVHGRWKNTYCSGTGSGKTTLGIELIRRMNGKALILAPSITIREQWIARIEEAFLCEGIQGEDYSFTEFKTAKGDHGCNLSGITQCHDKISGNTGRCR